MLHWAITSRTARLLCGGLVASFCWLLPTPAPAAVSFTDVTAAAGVSYVQHVGNSDPNLCLIQPLDPVPPELLAVWPEAAEELEGLKCGPERFSGGAAVGDYDGDGWDDLFVTRLDAHDLLFRNKGDGTFEDKSLDAGLTAFVLPTNGAAWGDIDNDGDADLYVTTISDTRHYLFVNDGAGHFTEEAIPRGAAVSTPEQHIGFSVAFGDYDKDGGLDLVTTEWRIGGFVDLQAPSHARLLHNLWPASPGFFEDVTDAAGVSFAGLVPFGELSWAPAFTDLDLDGWQDLAVVGDARTSRLFWNDQDGTFTDGTVAAGVGTDENGMGSTFGDYDGDGDLDWFVSSIFCSVQPQACSGHRLYRNEGSRGFSDQTDTANVRVGGAIGSNFEVGWGSAFFDPDNDGDHDLVMTNGVSFVAVPGPFPLPLRFWRNDGPGVMPEVAAAAGLTDQGDGKGLLTFDYDQDGDLDLFVVNNAGAPVLYRNDGGNDNDWIRVRVRGRNSNRDGFGARVEVRVTPTSPPQVREIGASTHFLGQSERVAHFGLGPGPGGPVHEVKVFWPKGYRSNILRDVARNQTLLVVEPLGRVRCGLGAELCLPLVLLIATRARRRRAPAAAPSP